MDVTDHSAPYNLAPEAREELGHLAQAVLSRWLGSREARRPSSAELGQVLAIYGSRTVVHMGRTYAAPLPEVVDVPVPDPDAVKKRLGLADFEHCELWEAIYHGDAPDAGVLARYDEAFLEAWFPRPYWTVVEAVILDGPAVAVRRTENALYQRAHTKVAGNRRRGEGARARKTVAHLRSIARSLFLVIAELRRANYPSDFLGPWETVGELAMPAMAEGGYDVEAPRPEEVRLVWNELSGEAWKRLGVRTFDEEAAAIAQLSTSKLFGGGLFRLVRNRMLLGLYVVLGGRGSEVGALDFKDFLSDRVGPRPITVRVPPWWFR